MSHTSAVAVSRRWRPRDIVVASVLAVAAGALFAVWNVAHNPVLEPVGAVVPGLQALGHGVWLLGGLLVALVVRKPGAALYGEVVAATVSALIGNQWGVITLLYGVVQGIGAELIFALFLYRSWGIVAALVAGAGSGIAMAILDITLWYAGAGTAFIVIYTIASVVSGIVIAGLGGWVLANALRRSGALGRR
jgi:energy-coupling factor transport system permease protein